jgi:hypothetical protein
MTSWMYFPAPTHSGEGLSLLINAQTMSELTGFAARSIRRFNWDYGEGTKSRVGSYMARPSPTCGKRSNRSASRLNSRIRFKPAKIVAEFSACWDLVFARGCRGRFR